MRFDLLWTIVRRELRGAASRAAFFVACLAVGVAAVVAVAGLGDSLDRTIRIQARPMLAADVAVTARRPLPDVLDDLPADITVRRADVRMFSTMVASPPRNGQVDSLLVDLKVPEPGYPFYGELRIEPAVPLHTLLGDDGVVVEASLLRRLRLEVGDTLMLGGLPFFIRGVVQTEPDRVEASLSPGPRVFVSFEGLSKTPLDTTSGRITYKALYEVPDEADLARLVTWLESQEEVSAWANIETWSDAQPALRRGLDQTEGFLGLVALLSLLVGGAGVAQVIRAWLDARTDTIAAFRCLGLTPGEVMRVYLVQTVVLASVGGLVGAALGVAMLSVVPLLLGNMLPPGAVQVWQPVAMLQGIGLGVGVAVLFAALPLRATQRVSPLRVLRKDVEPVQEPIWKRILLGLGLAGGVWGLAVLQSGNWLIGSAFAGVVAGVVLVLMVASGAIATALGTLGRRVPVWWLRHGFSALARPGTDTLGAMASLGLGVVVVLGTSLVQERVTHTLTAGFPPDAPTAFLIDVQPSQWDDIQRILVDGGAGAVNSAPMVVGRVAAVEGVRAEDVVAGMPDEDRWAYTREQRLSYMDAIPDHNTLVKGAFASDPHVDEVSLEVRYAERLGVDIGSIVEFDIQGVTVPLTVTSLREVRWESFQMNFFLIVEPGVLDAAPQVRLVTFQVDGDREDALRDEIAAVHPNVTLVSVRDLRDKATEILTRLGLAIRALGGFTAISGVIILFASASAAATRRAGQVAVLKALGTTRAGVAAMLAVEHALVGVVAGLVGALGAHALAAVLLIRLMRLGWELSPVMTLGAIVGSAVLSAVAGIAGSLRALQASPRAVMQGSA